MGCCFSDIFFACPHGFQWNSESLPQQLEFCSTASEVHWLLLSVQFSSANRRALIHLSQKSDNTTGQNCLFPYYIFYHPTHRRARGAANHRPRNRRTGGNSKRSDSLPEKSINLPPFCSAEVSFPAAPDALLLFVQTKGMRRIRLKTYFFLPKCNKFGFIVYRKINPIH